MPEKNANRSSKYITPLKALALSACMLLLGAGLCGIDMHFHPSGTGISGLGALFVVVGELVAAGSILAIIVFALKDLASRVFSSSRH